MAVGMGGMYSFSMNFFPPSSVAKIFRHTDKSEMLSKQRLLLPNLRQQEKVRADIGTTKLYLPKGILSW